jgi:hypothetical protein
MTQPVVQVPKSWRFRATQLFRSRVHYFGMDAIPGLGGKPTLAEFVNSIGVENANSDEMRPTLYDNVCNALAQKLARDYAIEVGIRGVVVNIGPRMQVGQCQLKTLYDVLGTGTELHNDRTFIKRFSPQDTHELPYLSVEWLEKGSKEMWSLAIRERRTYIFPGIIVYDLDVVERMEGTEVRIPEEQKDKAILRLYVLDQIRPM